MRFYVPQKKHGAQKKKLAAITSMLGNIDAHFPQMKMEFLNLLRLDQPELFGIAIEEGIIDRRFNLSSTLREVVG